MSSTQPKHFDAWSPAEIAARIEAVGVAKARSDALTVLVLSVLAGAFMALGGAFYLVTITNSGLGFGATRLIGGVAFSLGLILVVIAGAQLFTGNNLVAMAWASRRIHTGELLRNWALVYVGNVIGSLGTVALVRMAGVDGLADGDVGQTALSVGQAKAGLGFGGAFARGILGNALVCLAVWLAMGGRSVTDKILAIILPKTAFVALGLEHSIANWFYLPYAATLGALEGDGFVGGALMNLVAVTIGNVLGGTLLVAGVYWLAYLRPAQRMRGPEEY